MESGAVMGVNMKFETDLLPQYAGRHRKTPSTPRTGRRMARQAALVSMTRGTADRAMSRGTADRAMTRATADYAEPSAAEQSAQHPDDE
jgi:hypothetical protein